MKDSFNIENSEEQIIFKDKVIYTLAIIIAFVGIFGFFVKIVFF
jgi:hypothetical protein